MSIISLPRTTAAPDARPLAYALTRMHPDLTALILPGETWDDMMARKQASLDILDDLLAEYADAVEAVA